MIVISGALVIVALGLLIAGLVVSSGLVLVYASIGVSVLSAVFLFLGVRQRRGDDEGARVATTPGLAAATAAPAAPATAATAATPAAPATAGTAGAAVAASAGSGDEVRAVPPRRPAAPVPVDADPVAAEPAPVSAGRSAAPAGEVFVVPGRPRYHAAGCRYLSGRETETRSIAEAQAEGFAACGVCRPDETTSTAAPAAAAAEPAPARPAPASAAPRRRAPQTRTAQADSPEAVAARQASADDEEPPTAPARAVAAATPAAGSRTRGETVVVIPERGRFHRPDCRYVRDVEGAREMTKTGARRQGYSACGVCKP